jgi:hypothetical protein
MKIWYKTVALATTNIIYYSFPKCSLIMRYLFSYNLELMLLRNIARFPDFGTTSDVKTFSSADRMVQSNWVDLKAEKSPGITYERLIIFVIAPAITGSIPALMERYFPASNVN